MVIFVKSVARARELAKLLETLGFPAISIHSGMKQEERYAAAAPPLRGRRPAAWH